jgi:hypothetical protein
MYVVTENVGYDVGMTICGVFSSRQKAESWVEARRAAHASKVREGKAVGWGAPAYDVEEFQVDPA